MIYLFSGEGRRIPRPEVPYDRGERDCSPGEDLIILSLILLGITVDGFDKVYLDCYSNDKMILKLLCQKKFSCWNREGDQFEDWLIDFVFRLRAKWSDCWTSYQKTRRRSCRRKSRFANAFSATINKLGNQISGPIIEFPSQDLLLARAEESYSSSAPQVWLVCHYALLAKHVATLMIWTVQIWNLNYVLSVCLPSKISLPAWA